MSDVRYALSVLILLLSVLGLIVWIWWVCRKRKAWALSIGPISWLTAMIIFYSFVVFPRADISELLASVSAGLRLFELLIILAGGVIFLREAKQENES